MTKLLTLDEDPSGVCILNIAVPSIKDKEQVLEGLKYLHGRVGSDKKFNAINTLVHLYLSPNMVRVGGANGPIMPSNVFISRQSDTKPNGSLRLIKNIDDSIVISIVDKDNNVHSLKFYSKKMSKKPSKILEALNNLAIAILEDNENNEMKEYEYD